MNPLQTALAGAVVVLASGVSYGSIEVVGGRTSVLLDTAALSSAASLDLSGVAGGTVAPGGLGADSVAFPINARDAGVLPTTFEYEPGLASFGGTIEHTGRVLFNGDTVEVGDFTIGFDAARVGGDRSGFFVESTAGIAAILFDVGTPSSVVANEGGLRIAADLLVSSEFAGFLLAGDLAAGDLTGVDVGDAFVSAVPAPGAAGLACVVGVAALRRRR